MREKIDRRRFVNALGVLLAGGGAAALLSQRNPDPIPLRRERIVSERLIEEGYHTEYLSITGQGSLSDTERRVVFDSTQSSKQSMQINSSVNVSINTSSTTGGNALPEVSPPQLNPFSGSEAAE